MMVRSLQIKCLLVHKLGYVVELLVLEEVEDDEAGATIDLEIPNDDKVQFLTYESLTDCVWLEFYLF